MEVDEAKLKDIENDIRDITNWIAVFEEEYSLEKEVVDQLRSKLEAISSKIANL